MTKQRAFMNAAIMAAIHGDILTIDSLVGMFNTVTEAVSTNYLEEREDEDDLTVSLHSMLGNLSPEEKVQAMDMIGNKFFSCTPAGPSDALDALVGAVGKVKQEMGDPLSCTTSEEPRERKKSKPTPYPLDYDD